MGREKPRRETVKGEVMHEQKTIDRFLELRASGISYAKISAELHVGKRTLIEWSGQHQMELHNLREVARDELLEKHRVTVGENVKALAERMGKIRTAAAKVDLTAIAPERLLRLEIEYSEHLASLIAASGADTTGAKLTRRVEAGLDLSIRETWAG